MRAAISTFFLLAVTILIFGVLILGWLGFVPRLSTWLGSDRPKDLGIVFTDQDLRSADQKRGSKMETIFASAESPKETLKYFGNITVETSLNSAEASAILNRWAKNWRYFPLSDIQVRINENDTVELSARFRRDRIGGYAETMGYDAKQVEDFFRKFGPLQTSPPIYLKGIGSVSNNQLFLDLQQLKIGRMLIPQGMYVRRMEDLAAIIQKDWLESVPGCYLQALSFKNGQVIIKGTYPAVELVAP